MKYRVRLEKTDEGYAVWCPGLPGCWSQGATEEEALENITDAINTYEAIDALPNSIYAHAARQALKEHETS